ncbi:MAG TPA: SDR family oxidoreductase [Candidatus Limnocylindria bacterium]
MTAPATAPAPGTVVIVTGGAHGIGREYCRAFAAVGAKVVVADIDRHGADLVARDLGRDAIALAVDVADERSVGALAPAVTERFGGIDVLVNNAAMYATVPIRRVGIADLTVAEWDAVMAVNLRGMFLCSRAVVPAMKARGAGRIINIASGTVFAGSGALHYATSKAGVLGFTRNLARELGPHGITVNTLAPGATVTEMTDPETTRSHADTARSRAIPRAEVPADIVGAAVFLASPAAAFITGQTLVVDGGRTMH